MIRALKNAVSIFLGIFLLMAALGSLAGCELMGEEEASDDDSGKVCSLSVYGSVSGDSTEVQIDAFFNTVADIVPLDVTINGTKVDPYNKNDIWVGYRYRLGSILPAGSSIPISISREGWGKAEYDMIVCASPDTAYLDAITYSTPIDDILKNIDQGKNDFTKLDIGLPSTEITGCNAVTAWIMSPDNDSVEATKSGTNLSFDLGSGNARWTTVRDSLVSKRSGGTVLLTFKWSGDYALGSKATVTSYYIGLQGGPEFSLPYKIEGVYDLSAYFKATSVSSPSDSVSTNGHTDILTLTRDFETLTVTGNGATVATGTIDGINVSLAGHILDPGVTGFDGQEFTGWYYESTGKITGSIAGYASIKLDGESNPSEQCSLSNAGFTLTAQ